MASIARQYIRKGIHILKDVRRRLRDFGTPFIQNRDYLGYKVYFSRGTTLIDRIRQPNAIYEKDTSELLVKALGGIDTPHFIDIGSNIGLLSLYVHKFVPDVQIYAFEPGPHQHQLFQRTIQENNLQSSIQLFQKALSNQTGTVNFYIHHHRHASGDGFYDTERAGKVKPIQVSAVRLDDWWREVQPPKVDLIKIDTEGAELMVIEGAMDLIKAQQPAIILEICDLNYKSYPYDSLTIVKRLTEMGYEVQTFDGKVVNIDNIKTLQTQFIHNYYCQYQGKKQ